jgi:O-antigen/teichoic acid export membrane protein
VGTAVFLALKSEAILHLIANASYLIPVGGQNSADALKIVSFIFLFYFISSLFTYLLIASGKQARLLKINGWIALVNLLANALIIPVASFIGSAWVTLVTQMLLLAYTVRGTRDITRYHFAPRFTAAVLILALIGGGAVLGLSQLPANIHAFFGSSFFGYACDVALS